MSGADQRVGELVQRLFPEHLAGHALDDIGSIVTALQAAAGTQPDIPLATAVSALEQALWDLRGQQLGVPIHALFGGARRLRIPLYANMNRGLADRTPAGFAARAREAVAAGFNAVKCAPFDGVEPDRLDELSSKEAISLGIERVESVRQAVGDAIDVLVDCHGRFDVPTALQVADSLRGTRLRWYEEPVLTHPDLLALASVTTRPEAAASAHRPGFDELRRVAEVSPFPLAGGEFFFGLPQFAVLLRTGGLRYVMPDVKYCGGLWEALRISTLAEALGVETAPHNPSGPVGTIATAHVAAALPSFDLLEFQWGEVPWRADLVQPPEQVIDGNLLVPEAPGLGVRLNEQLVAEHRIGLEQS